MILILAMESRTHQQLMALVQYISLSSTLSSTVIPSAEMYTFLTPSITPWSYPSKLYYVSEE